MVVIDGVNYLTVEEVCGLLDVKPATIYAYVSRGVLRSYKQGIKRQRLYREDEIQRLLVIRPPEQMGKSAVAPPVQAAPMPAPEPVSQAPGSLPEASAWMAER
jgi:citrate synthase